MSLRRLLGRALPGRRWYQERRSGARILSDAVSNDSRIGRETVIRELCVVSRSTVGMACYLNRGAEIYATDLGSYSSLGQGCQVGANEHLIDYPTTAEALYPGTVTAAVRAGNERRTRVAEDVWIGARAVVIKGVTIGVGAVVGAGAVVTRDIAPYTIVTGVPAKPLRARFAPDVVARLLESEWWMLPPDVVRDILARTAPDADGADAIAFAQEALRRRREAIA